MARQEVYDASLVQSVVLLIWQVICYREVVSYLLMVNSVFELNVPFVPVKVVTY